MALVEKFEPVSAPPSRHLAFALAILHIAFGCAVIAGWIYRIPLLKGDGFGTFVAPNTALLFILCGLGILAQRTSSTRFVIWLGVALGIVIALFGAASAVQRLAGIDLGIDRLFLRSRLPDWTLTGTPQGRIAAPSAVAFMLAGISIAFLRRKRGSIVDWDAAGVFAIGYLAVLGYLYGLRSFYGYVMALPTAIMFLFSAAMLLAAAERSWLRSVALTPEAGGIVVRRLTPLILILLPSLGWVRIVVERRGLIPHEFATALYALTTVLVFTVSGLIMAQKLNRVDAERKQAQAALVQSEKLATAGRLAATVAHEINNPLAAALNSIFLARTSNLNESAQYYLQVAERELQRVAAMTRRSLGFYRGHNKPEQVDVSAELREVMDVMRPHALGKGVQLSLYCDDDLSVVAAAGELRQVFSNLVANAIEATAHGGYVIVEGRVKGRSVAEVTVRDNGCGIPPEQRQHIFEPFFTTKAKTGVGLGLFVVGELVNKNGGSVRCESSTTPGKHGTTFVVSLPLAKPHVTARASQAS
jgi:signal transduction histidine kinase